MRKLRIKIWKKFGTYSPEIWRDDHTLPSYRYANYRLFGINYYPEFNLFTRGVLDLFIFMFSFGFIEL